MLNVCAHVCVSRQTHFAFSKFIRQTPVLKLLLPLANDLLFYVHIHTFTYRGKYIYICIFLFFKTQNRMIFGLLTPAASHNVFAKADIYICFIVYWHCAYVCLQIYVYS